MMPLFPSPHKPLLSDPSAKRYLKGDKSYLVMERICRVTSTGIYGCHGGDMSCFPSATF